MKPVPKFIRLLVQAESIQVSNKSVLRLDADGLDIEDLTNSILEGELLKKERNERGEGRYKYAIIGPGLSGLPVYSCGKIMEDADGHFYFFITAHKTDQ